MEEKSLIDDLYEMVIDQEATDLGIDIENPNYAILSEEQANFFLRRVSEIREEKDKIDSLCNDEIEKFTEKVNAFRQQRLKTFEGTESYFLKLLEKFASATLDGTSKKSVKLPFGTMQFRKSADKYEYDDTQLMEFLTKNKKQFSKYIRTKEEISKTDIKKDAIVTNGKLIIESIEIPGVSVTEGQTSFSVK